MTRALTAQLDARPTTTTEAALIYRLVQCLFDRMTSSGHVSQLVTQEHLGHCKPDECRPQCLGYRALRDEALTYLEQDAASRERAPEQAQMFEREAVS